MNKELKLMSDLTIFSKYSKYIPEVGRRETWDEIVDRYEVMMMNKYPFLAKEIAKNGEVVKKKKSLPSMRAMQFAGRAIEVNPARGFNCCYLPINHLQSFAEVMFLLLGGSGVGYSVQKHHISELPPIIKPTKHRKYLIQDSIIGWADAIKMLMKAYLNQGSLPEFDFRDIRTKGSHLVTAGGKAPGPEPLKMCLIHIQAILDRKKDGEYLSPLEAHDILCHIANSVLAGGIRRSAMICLFSEDDDEMLTCKYGTWWELNEQRGRANNSVVLMRNKVTKSQFDSLWHKIELSGSGEPGIYWTNDRDLGTNPCVETCLRPFQFCNLCDVNVSNLESQEDLNERVAVASFFGTLQAGFTDFHYLRPIWKKTTEKDALIGIGMTGIASGEILKYSLKEAAAVAVKVNVETAAKIGINRAARATCIKPSGTTSCVLGCSSGIHAWHSEYYLRTMRFNKDEEVSKYFMTNYPEVCEDDVLRSHDTLCIRIPIKAPEGAIMRSECALDTLKRVKKFAQEWIVPGHIDGDNTHNVSATISIDKNRRYSAPHDIVNNNPFVLDSVGDFDEWEAVGEWMWENKEFYNGISVLPYDGGSYTQAPFESITEEEYEKRMKNFPIVDFREIQEEDDNVQFGQIAACAGGQCEI